MGNNQHITLQMNMKMILALFAVALCSVAALPSSDDIVPEGHSEVAHSEVALVQHGKGICNHARHAAAHWKAVTKTKRGRVSRRSFVRYFMRTAFGRAAKKAQGRHYVKFLKGLFRSGLQMMPGTKKRTLGRHCFSAVAPLAFTFYKNGNGGYCW